MSEISDEVWMNDEIDLPVRTPSPGGLQVAIKFHERNVHRFLEWLEDEGLTICKGAMPQSQENIKERYHEFQYARRGLCVPSVS